MNRKNFEMSEQDLATLLDACKPTPMIAIHCGPTPSVQERSNNAWAALGQKMGFDHMTVEPTGQGDRFFSAISTKKVHVFKDGDLAIRQMKQLQN